VSWPQPAWRFWTLLLFAHRGPSCIGQYDTTDPRLGLQRRAHHLGMPAMRRPGVQATAQHALLGDRWACGSADLNPARLAAVQELDGKETEPRTSDGVKEAFPVGV
jgi:hypothetical protein